MTHAAPPPPPPAADEGRSTLFTAARTPVPQLVGDGEFDVVEASHRILDDGRHTYRVVLVVGRQVAPAAPALGAGT